MTTFFVNTSTLAKRYVNEVGSPWVRSWTDPSAGHVIVISDLAIVEMFSLLTRRVKEGTLSAVVEGILITTFLMNVEKEYLAIPIDALVLTSARVIVRKYGLRTLDSIQLACALQAVGLLKVPMTFACGDNKLLSAAAAEGFFTDNPNLHP